MTTTHNLTALRVAVLAEPGCDTVRLAFADALDEHGGEMEGKWAELIRVQIDIAGQRAGRFVASESNDRLQDWLQARESALVAELEPWLRRGERCGHGGGYYAQEQCPTCRGTGWSGSLSTPRIKEMSVYESAWRIPARLTRGFYGEVTCDWGWWLERNEVVLKEWPITSVEFTTRPVENQEILASDDYEAGLFTVAGKRVKIPAAERGWGWPPLLRARWPGIKFAGV